MSALQDLIYQRITDGYFFTGKTAPVNTTVNAGFGILNPTTAAKAILLTRFSAFVGGVGAQPIANGGFIAAPSALTVVSAIGSTPAATTAPFKNPQTGTASPVLSLNSAAFALDVTGKKFYNVPFTIDIQPGQLWELESVLPITTLYPVILQPGDWFGNNSNNPFNLFGAGTSILVYEFVQLP